MQQFLVLQQATAKACILDITPPTFGGISSLVPNLNGSLQASWAAATDLVSGVRYRVFIKEATATGLFSPSNIVLETPKLTMPIFSDALGSVLVQGRTYHVGVRAVDESNNESSNLQSLAAVALGVVPNDIAQIVLSIQDIVSQTCQTLVGEITPEENLTGELEPDTPLEGQIESC